MSSILDTQNWKRIVTQTYVDFKDFSLNGITGANPGTYLQCFGKPDFQQRDYLCYFDLGLEFLAGPSYIAYMYLHIQAREGSILKQLPDALSFHFQAFSGKFYYDKREIQLSELQDCDALLKSFNDPQYELHYSRKSTAYIAQIDGNRRTVVFAYSGSSLDMIILY